MLRSHLASDEGLWAETSAVNINITILQNTLKKKIVVRTARLEHNRLANAHISLD